MKPTLYLDLAKAMIRRAVAGNHLPGTNGEAECRCAISRAYYAAFNVAQEVVSSLDIEVSAKENAHKLISQSLGNSGDSRLESVGSRLDTLCTERIRADYKMTDTRPEDTNHATDLTDLAEEVITLLEQHTMDYKNDPRKKPITRKAILDWAKMCGKRLSPK